MCEFCGCAGRPARDRTTEQAASERKPLQVRATVAVTAAVESRADALDRRPPAETTAA